jgi:hypothetical protein
MNTKELSAYYKKGADEFESEIQKSRREKAWIVKEKKKWILRTSLKNLV